MGLYLGGLIIRRIFVSEIWGLISGGLIFFGGGGGADGGGFSIGILRCIFF